MIRLHFTNGPHQRPGKPLPAAFYGDPLPGQSALDKRKAAEAEKAKQPRGWLFWDEATKARTE